MKNKGLEEVKKSINYLADKEVYRFVCCGDWDEYGICKCTR